MNQKGSSVKVNIAYNTTYNIMLIIIPLIVTPYLSRHIGVDATGVFSFSLAVAIYFRRAALLGVEKYGNRAIALDKSDSNNNTFWGIYSVQFVSGLVANVAYGIYIFMFGKMELAAICQSIYVISGMFEVHWYFFGKEQFKTTVLVSSCGKLFYLIATFLWVNEPDDIYIYILISGLSYLLPCLVLFFIAIRKEKFSLPSKAEFATHLKGLLVLFIPVIAVTLYKSMDKLMLGLILETKYENGLYENAEKILAVPTAVIAAVSTVMMPKMTKIYRDCDDNKAENTIYNSVIFAAFIGIGCSFGLAGVSKLFSLVYWGAAFIDCAQLLSFLSITIPFMSFAEILRTQYIIPQKKDKTYIIAVLSGAFVNLIVNAFCIPKLGAVGAVYGTIAAECIVCIIQGVVIRKELPLIKYIKAYLLFIVPGFIMYMLLLLLNNSLPQNVLGLISAVLAGGFLYIGFSVLIIYLVNKSILKTMINMLKRS